MRTSDTCGEALPSTSTPSSLPLLEDYFDDTLATVKCGNNQIGTACQHKEYIEDEHTIVKCGCDEDEDCCNGRDE